MSIQQKLKIVWLAAFMLLVTASLTQGSKLAPLFGIDIIFHIGIYGMLAAIPLIVLKKRFTAFTLTVAVAPIAFLFETLHGSVTGYGFKMLDAFYNNIGIFIGVIFGAIIRLKLHYDADNNDNNNDENKP